MITITVCCLQIWAAVLWNGSRSTMNEFLEFLNCGSVAQNVTILTFCYYLGEKYHVYIYNFDIFRKPSKYNSNLILLVNQGIL